MRDLSKQTRDNDDPSWFPLVAGSRLLDGRFTIQGPLSHGSGGAVYSALDRERNEVVALKVLLHQDGASIFRLKQEFRALADVVHPNVVQLYELFGEGEHWFFTMELLSGVPLLSPFELGASEESGERPLSPIRDQKEARRVGLGAIRNWLPALAKGVQAIHDAGKVHCDLKPSNVLVTKEGRVVIVDFGLVIDQRAGEADSVTIVPRGTPAYVAPEVVMGQPATRSSDWYALGVMLHQAIFGALPFDGSATEVLLSKTTTPVELPPWPSSEEDKELTELCLGLLAVRPEDRFGLAEVMACVGSISVPTTPSWTPPGESGHAFVGREAELRLIVEEFDRARREGPRVSLIPGDSGVGKTALLAEACKRLKRHEPCARLLRSSCYERENLPFKAVDQALDMLRVELERWPPRRLSQILPEGAELLPLLFPVFGSLPCFVNSEPGFLVRSDVSLSDDLIALRRTAFQALGGLLASVARDAPLVLVLDDLQWADADSVRLLTEVLGLAQPPNLLILASYRDDGEVTSAPLATLLRMLDDLRIPRRAFTLAELEEEDAHSLVRAVSEDFSEDSVRDLVRQTHGFPYLTVQLAYQRKSGVRFADASLQSMLRTQIAELSSDARKTLSAIALSPAPVLRSILATCLEVELDQSALLLELRRDRLIRFLDGGANPRVDMYHDRVAAAVLQMTSDLEREQIHGLLADAWLNTQSAESEVLFHHLKGAGRLSEAGPYALLAAHSAEKKLAFEHAARCYEEALHLLDPHGEKRSEILANWAACLGAAGHGPRAAEVYVLAARQAPQASASTLRWRAVEQLLQSRSEDGSFLLEVLNEHEPQIPSETARSRRLMLQGLKYALQPGLVVPADAPGPPNRQLIDSFDRMFFAGIGLMFGGNLDLCIYLLVEATRLGIKSGEPGRLACACALRIEAELHIKGISEETAKLKLSQTRALLLKTRDPTILAYGHLVVAQAHYGAANLGAAIEEFSIAAEQFAAIPGKRQLADAAETSVSFMRLLRGDVSQAGRLGSSLMVLGEARGQPFFRKAGHLDLAALCMAQGRSSSAKEHLDRLVESAEDATGWFGVMFLHFGAILGAYDSNFRLPFKRFLDSESQIRSMAHRHHYRPWLLVGKAVTLLDHLQSNSLKRTGLTKPKAISQISTIARQLQSKSGIRVLIPYGFAIEAALRFQQNQASHALLERAEQLFHAHGAAGYQSMLRRCRGLVTGGNRGAELIEGADENLRQVGVLEPERLSAAYFPGFYPSSRSLD